MVSFGIHNYKISKAWDGLQSECNGLKRDLEIIKSGLTDQDKLSAIEKKIKSSKITDGSILLSEMKQMIGQMNSTGSQNHSSISAESNEKDLKEISKEVGIVVPNVGGGESGRVI